MAPRSKSASRPLLRTRRKWTSRENRAPPDCGVVELPHLTTCNLITYFPTSYFSLPSFPWPFHCFYPCQDFSGGPAVRASVLLTILITSITFIPSSSADAQVRIARPRAVVGRPLVVARPTVFVGGYYYPALYRTSLWYNPWGPGWGPYYGFYGPAYGYYGDQYPIYGGRYENSGSVHIQVSPRQAEVFVDGYYAGTVDNFDGVFQRLNIGPGEHEIQIYLAGYRPFTQRFYLQPGKSFDIKHALEPLGPGEVAPPRPEPAYSGPAPGQNVGPTAGQNAGSGVGARGAGRGARGEGRSEEHTSEL